MRFLHLPVALILATFTGCAEVPNQTKLKPGTTFDLHAVAAQPDASTIALMDPDSGATMNLVTPPIITAANVDSATVTTKDSSLTTLTVHVDNPGAANLQAATAVPGNQVVLVVNGKITSAPVIRSQISSKFEISGSTSRFDWEKIVE